MEKVIEAKSISKSFSGVKVIQDLSFFIRSGEIVGLLGPNGSGKTTTVRLLNGVITADAGHIRVVGLNPFTEGDTLRRRCGVLTESAGLYRELSGEENLLFFAQLYGIKNAVRRVKELLSDFQLTEHKDKKVSIYSTGMLKRLGIARALLHKPQILYLDEPTTGLDPEGARDLLEYIKNLNQKYNVTILLCTHLLKQVQTLCHRFIFIHKGQLLEEGTLQELEDKYLRELSLKVETDLSFHGQSFESYPILKKEPGAVVFRVQNKEAIPLLLRKILKKGPLYSAEICGRDLETLYFKVREAHKHE
ncbi:MAG: ABC transporter ATP-binding protein [Firmicutes bacterium]|nr:ABC transporter ATP-binding protein [Bacillota bacterium]